MYKLEVFSSFSAAHRLRNYKGKCENVHGHNWKVGVEVASGALNKTGIVMDFGEIKKKLKNILMKFDHKDLNALACFKKTNPTSENIAKIIFEELKKRKIPVSSVSVWEAEDSKATYCDK